jgi:hypothetical protein
LRQHNLASFQAIPPTLYPQIVVEIEQFRTITNRPCTS